MTTHLEEVLKESDPDGWQEKLVKFVAQHAMGEWGEMSEEDLEINEDALKYGGRLMSATPPGRGSRCGLSPRPTAAHDQFAARGLLKAGEF
jgi:hypothetical protein